MVTIKLKSIVVVRWDKLVLQRKRQKKKNRSGLGSG